MNVEQDIAESNVNPAVEEQADTAWTERSLAAMLLRLLGVYFLAWGLATGAEGLVKLHLVAVEFGLQQAFSQFWSHYLVSPGVQAIIGIYLLFGGKWVFEKVLMPIPRHPAIDDLDNATPNPVENDLQ